MSVLDIETVPDVVKWTYRGQIFNLGIEFEDESLFAEAANGTDVDMHEGDDSSGAKRHQLMMLDVSYPTDWGPFLRRPRMGRHHPLWCQ